MPAEQRGTNMMGRSHALTGLATGLGVSMYAVTLSVPAAVLGTAVCTGASILPDIDHPDSTVSNVYGPITRGFSWVVARATGGHRRGTHSIAGVALLALLAQVAVMYRHNVLAQVALCAVLVLALAGVIRLLKIPGWIDDVAPIPVVLAVVMLTDVDLSVVPPALALGCLVHIAGDVVTLQGCPLWWPMSGENVRLAWFRTNGTCERRVVVPIVMLLIGAEILWKVVAFLH